VSVERGAWFSNGDRAYRIRQGGSDEWLAALGPNGDRTFKSDSIKQYASILNYVDKRDNVRLRELSIAYNVPQRLSGSVGAGATSPISFGRSWSCTISRVSGLGRYSLTPISKSSR